MSTLTRMSSQSLTPLTRRPSARRRLTVALIGLSLPLLAACSSGSDSPAASDGVALPGTGVQATAVPTEGAATPTIAANGDPFCDLAAKAQADELKMNDATAGFQDLTTNVVSGTAPIADLNAWGSTLYDLAENSAGFFGDAAPYVAGTDAESDFAAMKGFITTYSMGLAAIARDAKDGESFMTDVSAFVQTPDVQTAMTSASTSAGHVSTYILDRCPAAG